MIWPPKLRTPADSLVKSQIKTEIVVAGAACGNTGANFESVSGHIDDTASRISRVDRHERAIRADFLEQRRLRQLRFPQEDEPHEMGTHPASGSVWGMVRSGFWPGHVTGSNRAVIIRDRGVAAQRRFGRRVRPPLCGEGPARAPVPAAR